MSSDWSSAATTAPTVSGPIAWPPSTSSTSSSSTARASTTRASSPASVSRLPRSETVQPSRSRNASSTPSPTPASSAATSFGTVRTSCMDPSVGAVTYGACPARSKALGELLAHELADDRAVRPPGDTRHRVRHHAAEIADRRRADLGDHVVHDLLELVLGELVGHELLDDVQLELLAVGLLLPAGCVERLHRLDALLALTRQHLARVLVGERALQFLLCGAEGVQNQRERVAPLVVAGAAGVLELPLDVGDQRHSNPGRLAPRSICEWRWTTFCPPPGPTWTISR